MTDISNAAAVPPPWRKFVAGSEGVYIFPDTGDKREDMKFIAIVNGRDLQTDQLNAEFILCAVNSFKAMQEVVKKVLAVGFICADNTKEKPSMVYGSPDSREWADIFLAAALAANQLTKGEHGKEKIFPDQTT